MRITEIAEPTVVKAETRFGEGNRVRREVYRIHGVPTLDASLLVLTHPDLPLFGRVIQTISVHPVAFEGKGYAQMLYLAALRDGPLVERPEFRSERPTRIVEYLIQQGKIRRVVQDGISVLEYTGS